MLREDPGATNQGEVSRPQQRRQTKHERKVEACGKANQHRQGKKLVRGEAATRGYADAGITDGHWHKPKVLMFNGREGAYMHARTASDIYVELREEDKTSPGDGHRCGKFVKSMYGE